MEAIHTRAIAGAGLALSLIVGSVVASRLTLATADAVELALGRQIDPEAAEREHLSNEASYKDSAEFYATRIAEAVETHGVADPGLDRLRQPNTFYDLVSPSAPRTIKPGASFEEAGLQIRVKVEQVEVQRRGLRSKQAHTLADITNVGENPIAYFLDMRADTGDCQVTATGPYNTMVLSPGQIGEVSICAGTHAVEITELKIIEVTELGALWVSKIPPLAVGHDEYVARAHDPGPEVQMCAEIPAVDFNRRIAAGEMQWEDLVDFYSRHDCEHFRWYAGYTRIIEPLDSLPALPEP